MAKNAADDVTAAYPLFAKGKDFFSTHEAPASAEFVSAMQALNPRRAEFVKSYLSCGNGAEAARKAGYAVPHCAQESYRLLRRDDVRAAIDAARATLAESALYDLEKAMAEAMAGIRFAIETGNANAMAKLVEHRARLNGLLVERVDLRTVTVDITAALNEARSRMLAPAICFPKENHDA